MNQDEAMGALALMKTRSILGRIQRLEDKAMLLEKEIGLDSIYGALSMGQSLTNLASSIGFSKNDLEYVLTRTPDHQKRYLQSTMFLRAKKSGEVLDSPVFSKMAELDKEENNAAKHHASMIDASLKSLYLDKQEIGSQILVQNTIVVRDKEDIPVLPEGLGELIEHNKKEEN